MLSYIFLGIFILLCVRFLLKGEPEKIKGIYDLPNKWYPLKYVLFRIVVSLRKYQNKKTTTTAGKNAGYGLRSRSTPEEMEKAQILPTEHALAVDAVYVNGGSPTGHYIVAATARRQKNIVQTILYLRIPDIGLLEMPNLPDTTLIGTHEGSYSAGGLSLELITPMKKWKIRFEGKMRIAELKKEVDVHFELDWDAYTDFFDFDTDLHPSVTADAIARCKWSREFFDTLKSMHQTHYEQFGEITGKVHISGYGERDLKLQGVRDHSYGNIRDWKYFHRYAIQYLHFSDGSAVCVGIICMPVAMTRLVIGYIFHPDGRMDAISSTDFEFYKFGDDGDPPNDMSFNFVAGGKTYEVTLHVVQSPVFYIEDNWNAKIFERFCTSTLNGVNGWGISEWDYRNYAGREAEEKRLMAEKM